MFQGRIELKGTEQLRPEAAPRELAACLIIDLRHHAHFNNVLTHASGAEWPLVLQTLTSLLDPAAEVPADAFGRNLLELLCGERGVTGKMLKPWFTEWLGAACGTEIAQIRLAQLDGLYRQCAAMPPCRRKAAMRILREHDERCARLKHAG